MMTSSPFGSSRRSPCNGVVNKGKAVSSRRARRNPARVKVAPRPCRRSSFAPNVFSSACICRLSVGWPTLQLTSSISKVAHASDLHEREQISNIRTDLSPRSCVLVSHRDR